VLLVTLPPQAIAQLMADADDTSRNTATIDVAAQTLRSHSAQAGFELLPRHRRMFLEVAGRHRVVADVPEADRCIRLRPLGATTMAARCRGFNDAAPASAETLIAGTSP
jgi:hypothetical protein